MSYISCVCVCLCVYTMFLCGMAVNILFRPVGLQDCSIRECKLNESFRRSVL